MQRKYRMNPVLLTILLGVVGALAETKNCPSGQRTKNGECCEQCPPGEGVVSPCGDTQTKCASCLDSETFSSQSSHTEKCQNCTKCTGLLRMETPCTDSNDAICVCDYGFFMHRPTGNCVQCTRCPKAQGVLVNCGPYRDTICEVCEMGSFSDQESLRDPCMPCNTCEEEGVLKDCTPISDTVCNGSDTFDPSYSPSPTEDGILDYLPSEFPTDSIIANTVSTTSTTSTTITTTTSTFGESLLRKGLNDKLIPIYCSILAAVVVGLVAFIIFKRWNSCKQNKQGANNSTTNQNQTPSPEGEKLHSDSGISVDSQSLQEQQGQTQTHTVVSMDEEPCLLLPLIAREKLETLLFRGGEGKNCNHIPDSDWYNLAGLLGYESERIATFQQEEHPVRALLSDWARKDCASIDALCAALRKINREDIAQSLVVSPTVAKSNATSVV
uniref:Tumor necrosis factor receptor superfamily member 16 n=1 Tax=Oryzias latipes TaxID=8090 RepID=A0A3P9MFR1_ORYLA